MVRLPADAPALTTTPASIAPGGGGMEPQQVLLYLQGHEEELLAGGYEPGMRHRHEILGRYQPAFALARQWAGSEAKPNSLPEKSNACAEK
jgi:hypothetical protein